MAYSGNKGFKRLVLAFGYSLKGFKATYVNEEAFRQEVWLALVLIPLGLYLGETGVEKVLLAGSMFVVLLVEILNSAIEAVVDRFGGDLHDLSGMAKDMGSAAVMLSLVMLTLTWGLILFL